MAEINLVDLCQSRIAKLIAENKIKKILPCLPVAWSNSIFDKIINHEYPTTETFKNLHRMLEVRNVCLDMPILRQQSIRAVFNTMLHGIEILDLKSWYHFHFDRIDWVGNFDNNSEPAVIRMRQVLEELVRFGTRLKHLAIDGTGVEFWGEWLRVIYTKLPNLQSLVLPNFPLTQGHLITIIDCYPELTVLDVTASQIQNLGGISRLPYLKMLSINECRFRDKQDIKELFRCKRIRVLRMAGDLDPRKQRSTTLSLFLKCKRVLPRLRVLDCSHSTISEKRLQRLLKYHRTLEIVGLIGTDLELLPHKIDGKPRLQLLTIGTFEASINSLNHYSKHQNPRRLLMEKILEAIKNFLQKDYKNLPRDQISQCFDLLCQIYTKGATHPTIMVLVIECLAEVCRDLRALELSFAHRQQLLRSIRYDTRNTQRNDPLKFTTPIISKICEILDNDILFYNSEENVSAVASTIFIIMNNVRIQLIRGGPIIKVISCLKKCLRNESIRQQYLDDFLQFEMIVRYELKREEEEFELCAHTLTDLVTIRLDLNIDAYPHIPDMNTDLLECFGQYFDDAHTERTEEEISILLASLKSIIGRLPVNVLNKFTTVGNFDVYLNLLSRPNRFIRQDVFWILHTMKSIVAPEDGPADESIEESAEHIGRAAEFWADYEEDWEYPDIISFLQNLNPGFSETSKSLLNWILEYYEDEEDEIEEEDEEEEEEEEEEES